MICPNCQSTKHRVVFTRQAYDDKTVRRKRCADCGTTWYSAEVIVSNDVIIHNRNESQQRGVLLARRCREALDQAAQ